MALSDLEILARLIQCEAGGEGENGMQTICMCYGNGKRFLQYAKSI